MLPAAAIALRHRLTANHRLTATVTSLMLHPVPLEEPPSLPAIIVVYIEFA